LPNMGSSLKWKGLRMLTPRSSYSFGKDDSWIVIARTARPAPLCGPERHGVT